MTCALLHERLDDYVDGLLDEAEYQEIELHLAACDACRLAERRLRTLLAQAARLPREIAPGRDLWPGVAGRLGAPRLLPFARRPAGAVAPTRPAWLLPALATAAAVLALSALVPRAQQPAPQSSASQATRTSAPLDVAQADYARAAADLKQALDARRAELPPATVAAVEQNLRTIDQALGEISLALQKDPGNTQLAHLLNATHRRKVSFLQQIVRLSTRL